PEQGPRRCAAGCDYILSHTFYFRTGGEAVRDGHSAGACKTAQGLCTCPRRVGENNLNGESRPLPVAWYGNARAAGVCPGSHAGRAGRGAARAAACAGAKTQIAADGSIRSEPAAAKGSFPGRSSAGKARSASVRHDPSGFAQL